MCLLPRAVSGLAVLYGGGNPALAVSRPAGSAPATDAHPQRTGAGADLPGVRGIHPGLPPRTKAVVALWGWFALVRHGLAGRRWNTVFAQSLDGQHMLRLYLNWINGQDDGTLKDNYFWFYIKNIGLVYLLLIPAFLPCQTKAALAVRRRVGHSGSGGICCVLFQQL